MTLLAIDWSTVPIQAAQFILSFSILILLHEFGHFITARWFGCRVEKFYLFFNPWFSLFKKKKGDTEYGIGWIPLGGYVKISGMIDESMDKEQMKQPPQPHEFRSKPAWQRLIIMLGGIIVNVILAIVIFIFILGQRVFATAKRKVWDRCRQSRSNCGVKRWRYCIESRYYHIKRYKHLTRSDHHKRSEEFNSETWR
jgi:RIP metalloprotease RseP